PFLRRHDDLGRPQHVVSVAVALAVDLDDRPARGALDGLLGDRLVAVGVERLALGRVGLDPHARKRRQQLVLDEPDAVGQVVVAVLGLGLGGVERPREVVDRGQQLLRQLGDAASLGLRDVAARALAHVVELRHRAEVLVAVVGLGRGLGLRLRGLGDAGRGGVRLRAGRAVAAVRRGHRRLRLGRRVDAVGGLTPGRGAGGLLGRRRRGSGVALHGLGLPLVHDLGVDDVLLLGLGLRAVLGRAVAGGALLLLGALVHRLGDLVERALERLGLGVDLVGVLGGQALADVLDRGLDLLLGGGVDLLGEVLELALGLVGRVLAAVAGLRELTRALVLVGVG